MSTLLALGANYLGSPDLTVRAHVLSIEPALEAADILDSAARFLALPSKSNAKPWPPRDTSLSSDFEGEHPAGGGTVRCEYFEETPQQPALVQVEWTSN